MFHFPSVVLDTETLALQAEVRDFLDQERAAGGFVPAADCWVSHASPEFSAKLGARDWLGMLWPKPYGGGERPVLHRYVVTEELLAAGAPVAAHWVADRQSGNQILRYGTEAQKQDILPRIAAGTCYFAIGMSEPQAGSDLAAVVTRAERRGEGWRLNGRKIWSTGAHFCDYMIVLARTSPPEGRNRHVGLSQFLVDLKAPGVEVSGIRDLSGAVHFNETVFDDVVLPDDALLGEEGNGWTQVLGELAMERSGPERFLTCLAAVEAALPVLAAAGDDRIRIAVGRWAAELKVLRRMSLGITRLLQEGGSPATEAALVKEVGNRFENEVIHELRRLLGQEAKDWPPGLSHLMRDALLHLPSNTLRGGTTEILKGMVARQLGMR